MTVLDGPIGRLALNLINRFGRPVTYVERDVKGVVIAGKTVETRGVMEDVASRFVDGTTVFMTDAQVLVPGLPFEGVVEPSNRGALQIGAKEYQVIRPVPISSGEKDAVYSLIVRR